MARFLLDSDICSFVMKRSHPALLERIRGFAARELAVSVVSAFELEHGVLRSGRHRELRRIVEGFLELVTVLPWDRSAALRAAAIRADLAARGTPIGAYDVLIAGHARSAEAVLVTNNLPEYSRVEGLLLENWTR